VQPACDFDVITPDLAIWHAYDAASKTELYSTCLGTADGAYLIDPVPLKKSVLDQLIGSSRLAAIIVTNANHHRAAAQFAQLLSVGIFAHADTFPTEQPSRLTNIVEGEEICDGLRAIVIDGAPSGEIALHYERNGGILIIGDALINFEPYGFTFLPAKYCSNQKQMQRSLRELLDYKAERILFAHGTPILSAAGERLRALLEMSL
jgi:glyoxylase-like metal-dependent hydrolase (beta-lactamase superfamily II)